MRHATSPHNINPHQHSPLCRYMLCTRIYAVTRTNFRSRSLAERRKGRGEKSSFASALRLCDNIRLYLIFERAASSSSFYAVTKHKNPPCKRDTTTTTISYRFAGGRSSPIGRKSYYVLGRQFFSGVIVWLCKRDRERAELKRVWRQKEGGKEMSPEQCFSSGAGKCVFFLSRCP